MVKVYQTDYEKTISGFGLGLDVSAKHTLFLDYNLDDKNKSEVLMPLKLVLKSDFDRAISLLKELTGELKDNVSTIHGFRGSVAGDEVLEVIKQTEEFLEECK